MAKSFIRRMSGVPHQLKRVVGQLRLLERRHQGLHVQLQRIHETLARIETSTSEKTSRSSQISSSAALADDEWDSSTVKPSSISDSETVRHCPPVHDQGTLSGGNPAEGGTLPPHVLVLREELPWLMVEMDPSEGLLDELSMTYPPLFTESDVESIRKEKRSSEKRRRIIHRLQSSSREQFEKTFLPVMARHQDHVADSLRKQYKRCLGKVVPECLACAISRQLNLRHVGDVLHSAGLINSENSLYISKDCILPRVRWDFIYGLLSKAQVRQHAWKCLISAVPQDRDELAKSLNTATEKEIANMKCKCNYLFRKQGNWEKCEKWVADIPSRGGIMSLSASPTESEDTEQEDASHHVKKNQNIPKSREATADCPVSGVPIIETEQAVPHGTRPAHSNGVSPKAVTNENILPPTVKSFGTTFPEEISDLGNSPICQEDSDHVRSTTEVALTAVGLTEDQGQQTTPTQASDDLSETDPKVEMPNESGRKTQSPGLSQPRAEIHAVEEVEQSDHPREDDSSRDQVSEDAFVQRKSSKVPVPIDSLEANSPPLQAKFSLQDPPALDENVRTANTKGSSSAVDKIQLRRKPTIPTKPKWKTKPSISQISEPEPHSLNPRERNIGDVAHDECAHPDLVPSQIQESLPKVDHSQTKKKPGPSPKPQGKSKPRSSPALNPKSHFLTSEDPNISVAAANEAPSPMRPTPQIGGSAADDSSLSSSGVQVNLPGDITDQQHQPFRTHSTSEMGTFPEEKPEPQIKGKRNKSFVTAMRRMFE